MHQGGDDGRTDLSGRWRAAVADEQLRRTSTDVDLDDGGWEEVAVPGHWRSTPAFADSDGPLLYRRRFVLDGADDLTGIDRRDQRSWLVLDGVAYTADVWLDGAYVGDTEGAFFPHGFEVTDQLAARDEHVLALEVACAPQGDRRSKRQLTGALQHGDATDPGWNPGGVWRPVRIERSGPVRIRHSRVICLDADERRATVALRLVLDARDAGSVRLRTTVAGIDEEREQPLAAGENRVEWTVTVPGLARWWPWALGEQVLHELEVAVVLADGAVSDRRRRRIGLRSLRWRDWALHVNGERLFLKGAWLAPTALALGEAPAERVAGDIALARAAGLNLVRVHAHVGRPELYDAADEQGVLVWQDMPLHRGYHRSVRRQARRQARELVDLLGHHPSIALWCAHDEPASPEPDPAAWTDPARRARRLAATAAAQLLPTWTTAVLDRTVKQVLEESDGSRAVLAGSGVWPHPPLLDGTDAHLRLGWDGHDERDLPRLLAGWPRLGRFVSGLGPPSVPDDDAVLAAALGPGTAAAAGAGAGAGDADLVAFDRYVPPAAFPSPAAWQEATQRYQASVLRHQIEALRRIRWRPCGGFAVRGFADPAPGITAAVLDHERRPKRAHAALVDACRPVVVVADRPPAQVRPGQHLDLAVHAISDARIAHSDIVATVQLSWRSLPPGRDDRPAWVVLAEAEQAPLTAAPTPDDRPDPETTWRWVGDLPPDSCVRIGTVPVDVPTGAAGRLLVLELWLAGDGWSVANRYVAGVAPVGGAPGPVGLPST